MKRIFFNLKLSKAFYVILVCCNVVLPMHGVYVQPGLFNLLVIAFWTYGLLSHLGYFLKQVYTDEDGRIEYETNIPILQIGFIRMAQIFYYFLRDRSTTNWKVLFVLIGIDVFYVIFMLVDKSRYYYESEEMQSESE